jgi:hypothetical protein
MYLKYVGHKRGAPWCAAFVAWVLGQCGVKHTITAWSPTAHNSKNVIYTGGYMYREVKPCDVFTIYYQSKGRIGHTGFWYARVSGRFYDSVEGNTNEGGSREGDGVYMRRRSYRATYSITRWIRE